MHYTEMSGIMAFLWSSAFILLIHHIRKNKMCFQLSEIMCVIILYVFSVIRMVVSIDFIPSVGINMPQKLSQILKNVFWIKRSFGEVSLTIAQMFLILWGIGIPIMIIKYVMQYRRLSMCFTAFPKDKEAGMILKRVRKYFDRNIDVDIRKSAAVSTPKGFGLIHKMIVLPDNKYSEDEVFYILLHECRHFLNHDLIVKMLLEIYICVFWWNPLNILLRKDLERDLEIQCDLSAVEKMSKKEVMEYLQTIIKILQKSEGRDEFFGTVSVTGNIGYELKERFQIIIENQKSKKSYVRTAAYTIVFLLLFILSYSFMPQPFFDAPVKEIETEQGVVYLKQETAYILHKRNSEYRLIQDGINYASLNKQEAAQFIKMGFCVKEEGK